MNKLRWHRLRVQFTGVFHFAISTCRDGTEGHRGIELVSLTLVPEGGRRSLPCPGHFNPRTWAPLPNVQEAGWTWRSISMSAENLTSAGVQTPKCPACSKLLYQQNYPGHHICIYRVSQEEWTKLRESVPYVKIYRYNPKPFIQSWTVTEIMAREVWKYDSCYTLTDYQIHTKTGRNMWFL